MKSITYTPNKFKQTLNFLKQESYEDAKQTELHTK